MNDEQDKKDMEILSDLIEKKVKSALTAAGVIKGKVEEIIKDKVKGITLPFAVCQKCKMPLTEEQYQGDSCPNCGCDYADVIAYADDQE